MDSADEAGGEAIYSSDGLPPITVGRAPKVASKGVEGGGENDVLDSNDMLVDPASASTLFSSSNNKETVAEKIARIQKEIKELQELQLNDDVTQLASDLAGRLQSTIAVKDDLAKFVEDKMKVPKTDASTKESETGVVYELYGASATPSVASVEGRLLKLEQLVGSSTGETSVIHRVEAMENQIKGVDPKHLEEAATKAKVIRSDLEAATKARSKLTSSGSSVDNKAISELHTQLIQLEGISDHLPALTHRLQQLAHLHVYGANFSSRLTEAETGLSGVQTLLESLKSSVEKVEQGMAENVKAMESNVNSLGSK